MLTIKTSVYDAGTIDTPDADGDGSSGPFFNLRTRHRLTTCGSPRAVGVAAQRAGRMNNALAGTEKAAPDIR